MWSTFCHMANMRLFPVHLLISVRCERSGKGIQTLLSHRFASLVGSIAASARMPRRGNRPRQHTARRLASGSILLPIARSWNCIPGTTCRFETERMAMHIRPAAGLPWSPGMPLTACTRKTNGIVPSSAKDKPTIRISRLRSPRSERTQKSGRTGELSHPARLRFSRCQRKNLVTSLKHTTTIRAISATAPARVI